MKGLPPRSTLDRPAPAAATLNSRAATSRKQNKVNPGREGAQRRPTSPVAGAPGCWGPLQTVGGIGGAPTRGPCVLPAMRDDLPRDRLRSSQGRSGSPRVPQSPAEGQSQSGGEGSPESWRGRRHAHQEQQVVLNDDAGQKGVARGELAEPMRGTWPGRALGRTACGCRRLGTEAQSGDGPCAPLRGQL